MNGLRFEVPIALALLIILPVVAVVARRRSPSRLAVGLRLAALALVITALASPTVAGRGGDLTIIFAVDRSASIAATQRRAAEEFVRSAAAQRRQGDRVGLVTFGAEALVEEMPSSNPQLAFATQPAPHATDIGGAIQAALSALPAEGAGRIVLLTDGNDNRGGLDDALALARNTGVEISVVPLQAGAGSDVLIDDVVAPAEVRVGEQYTVTVAVVATAPAVAELTVTSGGTVIGRRYLDLQPGRTIVSFPQVARANGLVHYAVSLTATPSEITANKYGEAVVMVRGAPVVWYVAQQPGPLMHLLTAAGLQVHALSPQALPSTSAGYRGIAAVICDDLPAARLSPAQMAALRDFVGGVGGGLVAVGGLSSFGAGEYGGTPLEEALPVTMDMRHRLAIPTMAIILVIDSSGSMGAYGPRPGKLDLVKEAAQSVIDLLREDDVIGVVSFDQEARWLALPTAARNRDQVLEQISRLQAGGGTDMHRGLSLAYDYLHRSQARLRHEIVLSDGLTDPGDFRGLLTKMSQEKITTSSVAVGADADLTLMQDVARWGGGRFYATRDEATIPQIVTAEAFIASRAQIIEEHFTPRVHSSGLVDDLSFPELRGYVAASPKPSATVHLVSAQDDPILASWQYGLGRAVAFTSDATGRWGADWMRWSDAGRFWSRLVRWVSRRESDDLQVVVDRRGDGATVVAEAVTAAGFPLDGLEVQASVTGPVRARVPLVQTAPGRYEGRLDRLVMGAYAVTVSARDGTGRGRLATSGFVIPYSPELKDLRVNRSLLSRLTEATGGRILEDPRAAVAPPRGATARTTTWPLLAAAALGLFVTEIAVRRVPAITQYVGALLTAGRARMARPPSAAEVDAARQYEQADQWTFARPDPSASESMQQAARLYIARLKAAHKGDHRRRGNETTEEKDSD